MHLYVVASYVQILAVSTIGHSFYSFGIPHEFGDPVTNVKPIPQQATSDTGTQIPMVVLTVKKFTSPNGQLDTVVGTTQLTEFEVNPNPKLSQAAFT